MSDDGKVVFHNARSGETFVHYERADGKYDLKFGQTGTSLPGHAVFDASGRLVYLRESDSRVIADDRMK